MLMTASYGGSLLQFGQFNNRINHCIETSHLLDSLKTFGVLMVCPNCDKTGEFDMCLDALLLIATWLERTSAS